MDDLCVEIDVRLISPNYGYVALFYFGQQLAEINGCELIQCSTIYRWITHIVCCKEMEIDCVVRLKA